MRIQWIIVVCATWAAVACGDDELEPTPAEAIQEQVAEAQQAVAEAAEAAEPEGEPDPCETLTEAIVRSTFQVPADTAIARPDSTVTVRRICTYTWRKPNAEELEAQIKAMQQERIREMMRQVRRGKVAQGLLDAAQMPSVEARVSLNFGPTFETEEAARAGFAAMVERMEQGISRRVQTKNVDQEVTFRASFTEVEGVGDQASWAPRMKQLAVLDGTRILYINVDLELEVEDNLDHAKRLAAAILRG